VEKTVLLPPVGLFNNYSTFGDTLGCAVCGTWVLLSCVRN